MLIVLLIIKNEKQWCKCCEHSKHIAPPNSVQLQRELIWPCQGEGAVTCWWREDRWSQVMIDVKREGRRGQVREHVALHAELTLTSLMTWLRLPSRFTSTMTWLHLSSCHQQVTTPNYKVNFKVLYYN